MMQRTHINKGSPAHYVASTQLRPTQLQRKYSSTNMPHPTGKYDEHRDADFIGYSQRSAWHGHEFGLLPLYPRIESGRRIQTKLSVSAPSDPYEQEAERVADAVMTGRKPRTNLASQGVQPVLRRAVLRPVDAADSRDPDENLGTQSSAPYPPDEIQRSAIGDASLVTPQFEKSLQRSLNTGGDVLPAPIRSFMESQLGWDFRSVRVHHDHAASTLARDINARAFTTANHIFFDKSQYLPETSEGRHLLAHELAHIIQQQDGSVSRQIQRQTACASYNAYDRSVDLMTYNCAGLALRDYQWHSPPSAVYDAILAKFAAPSNPINTCGPGQAKFWLWEYDIRLEDDQGTVVSPTSQDFHIVGGRVDASGNDSVNVYSKNGRRRVYGPGSGGSFRPAARDRALSNDPSEQPGTTPAGRPVFKVRTNMTETITCADCQP
jgi:hypothetical protein